MSHWAVAGMAGCSKESAYSNGEGGVVVVVIWDWGRGVNTAFVQEPCACVVAATQAF